MFEIPIVLFFFKREEKTLRVLDRIAEVQPRKLYLISDGPRTPEEGIRVLQCRENVERRITWPCTVVKNYAEANQGVYNRIGLGAKWVFEQEDAAIFLEDDNLPEISFFEFCGNLLKKYESDGRVLWVCGTNYLECYAPEDGSSYVFTKHVLPCGWASWSHKFTKFYEGDMVLWSDPYLRNRTLAEFDSPALARQWARVWDNLSLMLRESPRSASWDGQMAFSMIVHGLVAISPRVNLIKNIGVDLDSEHGGTSYSNTMTLRFCGMRSLDLEFPLVHPKAVLTDLVYEKRVGDIILLPMRDRFLEAIGRSIKKLFGIDQSVSLKKRLGLG